MNEFVRARFDDTPSLLRAADLIIDASVPPERMRVSLADEDSVELEFTLQNRAKPGALYGSAVGLGVGVVIATLLLTGLLSDPGMGLLTDPALLFVQVALSGFGFGMLVGVIGGIGLWKRQLIVPVGAQGKRLALRVEVPERRLSAIRALLERGGGAVES